MCNNRCDKIDQQSDDVEQKHRNPKHVLIRFSKTNTQRTKHEPIDTVERVQKTQSAVANAESVACQNDQEIKLSVQLDVPGRKHETRHAVESNQQIHDLGGHDEMDLRKSEQETSFVMHHFGNTSHQVEVVQNVVQKQHVH